MCVVLLILNQTAGDDVESTQLITRKRLNTKKINGTGPAQHQADSQKLCIFNLDVSTLSFSF